MRIKWAVAAVVITGFGFSVTACGEPAEPREGLVVDKSVDPEVWGWVIEYKKCPSPTKAPANPAKPGNTNKNNTKPSAPKPRSKPRTRSHLTMDFNSGTCKKVKVGRHWGITDDKDWVILVEYDDKSTQEFDVTQEEWESLTLQKSKWKE